MDDEKKKKLVQTIFANDPSLREAAEKEGIFKELEKLEKSHTEVEPEEEKATTTKSGKKMQEKKAGNKKDEDKKKEDAEPAKSKDKDHIEHEQDVDGSLDIEVVEDLSKPHFERCYAKIVNELRARSQSLPTGDEFRKLESDFQRYSFVREMGVSDHIKFSDKSKEKTCYDMALKRRETGNNMFKKRYYADAHELYTQSIQLFPAKLNNEQQTELSKSFANRATTACHMNEYRACLTDITRAFDLGYPDKLRYKLYEKQAKCYKHFKDYDKAVESLRNAVQNLTSQDISKEKKENIMSDLKKQLSNCESLARDAGSNPQEETPTKIPELSKSQHATLRNSSSLIDVAYNDVVGRHGVAKQDIHVGDVLVVEKPYGSVVLPPFYDTHCYRCYKRLKSAVACDHCITVRYCDTECKEQAWNDYHHSECGMLNYIDSTDNCWGHLAHRIIIKLGFDGLVKFKKYLDETKDAKWSEYGTHGELIESDDYKCVHSLVTHAEDRTGADLFFRAVKAAYLVKCLQKKKFFPEGTTSDLVDFAGGLLLSNLQLCPCNAHEISELQIKKSDLQKTKTAEIGAGLYPTLSLLNHTCDPNVVRYFYGDLCVTRAIHHIKKGEEIVDNYGALYPTQELVERKKHLEDQYFFQCRCKPCLQEWPLYKDMVDGEDAPPVLRCEKCGEALTPEKDEGLDEWPCTSCSHKHNILTRMAALDQSHDRFAVAIEAVIKGDRSAVRALEEHLDLMDRLLHLPWKMFNNAQEALKHNYGVSANCFSLP